MGGMLSFQCKFLAALRIGIMYAYPARLRASRARAAQNRRTVADGTVEWAAVPVSQLVGTAARFSVPSHGSQLLRDEPGDSGFHHRLRSFRRPADSLWPKREGLAMR